MVPARAGWIVDDLAVHRSLPLTVCAATDRGVHKTTDGGLTWRLITSGFAGVNGIAVALSNAAVVYAVNWGRCDQVGGCRADLAAAERFPPRAATGAWRCTPPDREPRGWATSS